MVGEIVSKLRDALSMFWETLDDQERRLVLFAAVYLGATLMLAGQEQRREKLKQEIKEELARG